MKKIVTSLFVILISLMLVGCSKNIQTPLVLLENVVSIQDRITFEVDETDIDQVGEIVSIELYQEEILIESLTDLTVREFTGLSNNTRYIIEVTYTYDLLDGNGVRTIVLSEEEFFVQKTNDIDEESFYISKDEVANYIATFHKLPNNYMTKSQAGDISSKWTTESLASIGGDSFENRENLLPSASGRSYYEADINYNGVSRGAERIVFSNDGFIFYTEDHYDSFVFYDSMTREWIDYSKDDAVFQKE